MNRPALKALLPYLCGGVLASYFTPQNILAFQFYPWLISAILVIAGIVTYKKGRLYFGSVLLSLSLLALGFFRYQAVMRSPIPPILYNQRVRLYGYVTYNPDQPLENPNNPPFEKGGQGGFPNPESQSAQAYISGKLSLVSSSEDKTVRAIKAKILVKQSSYRRFNSKNSIRLLQYGDVVELLGELRQPQGKRNDGGFDYRAYLARRGVFGIIYLRDSANLKKLTEKGGYFWVRWMDSLRKKVERIFENTMQDAPDYAKVLRGIILGQKRALPENILLDFQNSGVMHILAVSGLHVGMIAFAGFWLFKLFRLPEKFAYALTGGLVIIYASIVGYRPSVVRASVIIILYFIAKIIDRDSDLLNLLGFAALLLLLFNMASLWDVGFQLSFVTTAAIIYFMSKWEILLSFLPHLRPHQLINKILLIPFGVSLFAQIASQPIIARYFNRVYTIAILTNIAAVWVVWYIVCVAFITVITGLIWLPLALPFAYANRLAIWVLLKIIHFFAGIPYAVVEVPPPSFLFFIIYVAVIFAIANLGFLRRNKEKALIIALLVISICLWYAAVLPSGHFLEVTFLDVGLGDSAFVRFPDGKNILIDGGPTTPEYDTGERVIAPFLRYHGIRKIDIVILTHLHNDHGGGLAFILENFRVGKIIGLYHRDIPISIYRKLRSIADKKNIIYQMGNTGSLSLSKPLIESTEGEIEILNPGDTNLTDLDQSSINNNSIVLKLRFGQITFLFASDIETKAEYSILNSSFDIQADILKVPHHGSITSSSQAFLDAVNPSFAVISSSERNRFNFPSQAVLNRYRQRGVNLLQTSKSGAIKIITDGRRCWIRTMVK